MRLLYIANIRLPTGRAHGIQIMKTCESLAQNGAEVTLLVPNRRNNIEEDPFTFYNCKRNFMIVYVPVTDFIDIPKIGFFLTTLIFSFKAFLYSFKMPFDAIYSRDIWPMFFLSFRKVKKVFEAHDDLSGSKARFLTKHISGMTAISQGLKDFYQKIAPQLPITVAPDGVSVKSFEIKEDKNTCRKILNLPLDKKIVMYTGHLYEWKGVDVLAEAAKSLPHDTVVVFVGGDKNSQTKFKEKYVDDRIVVIPQQNHSRVPYFLKAADVVVLPNSGKETISRLYTSPMKLFEYMSSQTPIVASALPSIKEVLHEHNAVLVEPDSVRALEGGISKILNDKNLSQTLAEKAFAEVQQYDWYKRGKTILDFIKRI